jgi:hypothetical protein
MVRMGWMAVDVNVFVCLLTFTDLTMRSLASRHVRG